MTFRTRKNKSAQASVSAFDEEGNSQSGRTTRVPPHLAVVYTGLIVYLAALHAMFCSPYPTETLRNLLCGGKVAQCSNGYREVYYKDQYTMDEIGDENFPKTPLFSRAFGDVDVEGSVVNTLKGNFWKDYKLVCPDSAGGSLLGN